MNLLYVYLLFVWGALLVDGSLISKIKDNDIVSTEICKKLCKNGKVFSTYSPPKEPDCGSFISCRKCDYSMMTKSNNPSAVCSYVFSKDFTQSEFESQITLYYGKSQVIVPHNSTESRLSDESNVKDKTKNKKKHGLFTVFVDWKKVNGVDASQCSYGMAELEWSLYNTGTYRNWDITAILETKPEATFPFCHENVEVPLDGTRSSRIGKNLPTNLKRVTYSISQGRPTAIRLTKVIAVNQPEMKQDPEKILELLLNEYVSFRIGVTGISVKEVYSETFHDFEKKQDVFSEYSNLHTEGDVHTTDSFLSSKNSSFKDSGSDTSIKFKSESNKKNRFNDLMNTVVEKFRGKGFTDPLILDSLLSLGFYSCFRVICTKKRTRRILRKVELSPRIPLSLETARNVHSSALTEYINQLPPYHTVPLPIYNSEYWVRVQNSNNKNNAIGSNKLDKFTEKLEKIPNQGTTSEDTYQSLSKDQESQYKENNESSEFSSSFSDLLTLIALTNSEILGDKKSIEEIFNSNMLNYT